MNKQASKALSTTGNIFKLKIIFKLKESDGIWVSETYLAFAKVAAIINNNKTSYFHKELNHLKMIENKDPKAEIK